MKPTTALIERVRQVNDTHQHVFLHVAPALAQMKAGQSLLTRASDTWSPYVREQWFPVGAQKNTLIVERPISAAIEPGTTVDVLGVIGKPYRFRRTLRNVLLIAHDTPPTPLLMVIPGLIANHTSVTLLLLGTAVHYGTEHIPAEVEVLKGDAEFNFANRVTTVGWADQVLVVVNPADELANFGRLVGMFGELRAEIAQNYLFGVFQLTLPCGAGACSACMVRLKKGETVLTCTQGPAVDLTEVQF